VNIQLHCTGEKHHAVQEGADRGQGWGCVLEVPPAPMKRGPSVPTDEPKRHRGRASRDSMGEGGWEWFRLTRKGGSRGRACAKAAASGCAASSCPQWLGTRTQWLGTRPQWLGTRPQWLDTRPQWLGARTRLLGSVVAVFRPATRPADRGMSVPGFGVCCLVSTQDVADRTLEKAPRMPRTSSYAQQLCAFNVTFWAALVCGCLEQP